MVANGKVARRKGDFFASKSQVFGLAAPFSLLPAFSDRTANAARGALRRAIHALPSPLFSLPSTSSDRTANAARGALRRAIHALPSPLFSLPSTSSDRTANAARGALRRAIHALPSPLFSLPSTSSDRTANAARGALRRAIHALPSPLFSLPSTSPMHPLLPRTSAGRIPRAAIFLSGTGSNAEELLFRLEADRASGRGVSFEVSCLVTDAPATSRAAEIAGKYGLPLVAEDIREFYHARGQSRISIATPEGQRIREEWTDALRRSLEPYGVSFGIFAGFVPLTNLTAELPCLNVHPGDLTYLKDGRRYLVGLHQIPVERAILDGLDYLRSSVILATPVTGSGEDMDGGPLLGISPPMQIECTGEELDGFMKIATGRPARRPVGGFRDALEEYAVSCQNRLKAEGDLVVFYPVVRDFADDRFYADDSGKLFFRQASGKFLPILTVQYSRDGSRELLFG